MRIEITSQHEIEKMAKAPLSENTALISIGDFGAEPPKLHYKPKHMLRLEFDDIYLSDFDYEDCGKYAFRLFTSEQAERIAEFVYEHKSEIQTFICQCRFGQSRSAAVAAAIKEHFYHNGIDIFADENYYPNAVIIIVQRSIQQIFCNANRESYGINIFGEEIVRDSPFALFEIRENKIPVSVPAKRIVVHIVHFKLIYSVIVILKLLEPKVFHTHVLS